jgi:hypothetical protein
MSKVAWVTGPRNEMVDFTRFVKTPLAIETGVTLHLLKNWPDER